MRVWALWHGGSGYSESTVDSDLEVFPSIAAAEEAFRERYNSSSYPADFQYVGERGAESSLLPGVDRTARMDLYFWDPRQDDPDCHGDGPTPDRRLSFGPKLGVLHDTR